MLRKIKSKILTKLFTQWVNEEFDLETLALTKSMIIEREQKIHRMINIIRYKEVYGFKSK